MSLREFAIKALEKGIAELGELEDQCQQKEWELKEEIICMGSKIDELAKINEDLSKENDFLREQNDCLKASIKNLQVGKKCLQITKSR